MLADDSGVPSVQVALGSYAGGTCQPSHNPTLLIERHRQLAAYPLEHTSQMSALNRIWIALTSEASSGPGEPAETHGHLLLLTAQC
jgi:hypothetical protein